MASYDRDYVTTLPLLKDNANLFSKGKWNKYNEDIGEALIKLLASASHEVDFYFKKYLSNLTLPCEDWTYKNYIWELVGYKPPYTRADYLMIQLYWPDCGLDSFVPLYQYTPFEVIADGETYQFMAAEDYLIPPLTTRVNVRLIEGELHTLKYTPDNIKNNQVKLWDTDIDYDAVSLMISGQKWSQVRNVFYSPNTERIFSCHKGQDGTYLYLHSSWEKYVDEYDQNIEIYFVTSMGEFDDYTEECLSIKFKDSLYAMNGVDVSQAYRIFPMINADTGVDMVPSTLEGNRAITVDNIAEESLNYPGVATAKAYDWSTESVVDVPFKVVLVVTGKNGKIRERTKEGLLSYLRGITSGILDISIVDTIPLYVSLRVFLDIGSLRGTLSEVDVKRVVRTTVEEYFQPGNMVPGDTVSLKALDAAILRSDSRILFSSTSFSDPFVLNPIGIPTLKSVVVITQSEAHIYTDSGRAKEICFPGLLKTGADEGWVVDKWIDDPREFMYHDSAKARMPIRFSLPLRESITTYIENIDSEGQLLLGSLERVSVGKWRARPDGVVTPGFEIEFEGSTIVSISESPEELYESPKVGSEETLGGTVDSTID